MKNRSIRPHRGIRNSRADRVFYGVNGVLMALTFLLYAWPLWFVLIASFSDPNLVQAGQVLLLPKGFHLGGYKLILEYQDILRGYLNSILYTVVGTALNLLGTAGATVIVKAINTAANPDDVSSAIQYATPKTAFIVNIGKFEFNWFMLIAFIAIIFAWVTLYKTRFGLRLMACGEHPQAADSVGINVKKMRYSGVLISGAVGGLGGIAYVTAGVSMCNFEVGVAGFGFLALAVMIFGQWKPVNIGLAALLFGFFRALSNVYTGFAPLVALKLPSSLYNMLPYIISLVVLAFISRKSRAPKAEGIPYDKGQR